MTEGHSQLEEESFRDLVANNGFNLQYDHKTLIFKASEDEEKIKRYLQKLRKN